MTAETQAVLDTLLAAAPVGFGFVDREFRLLHLNEALAAVNGRPREEHLGRQVADVVPEIWAHALDLPRILDSWSDESRIDGAATPASVRSTR